MERCKTCKHWTPVTDAAKLRRIGPYKGECQELPDGDLVESQDATFIMAPLLVRADFGCTEHEPRD